MNIQEAKALKPLDLVWWNDPDNGICSGAIKIDSISIVPDDATFYIVEDNGDTVEGFVDELELICNTLAPSL
jgi:hypothetical protein